MNQYLHFHHRNTRELVAQWSRAIWPALFGITDPDENWLARNTFPGLLNNAEVVDNTGRKASRRRQSDSAALRATVRARSRSPRTVTATWHPTCSMF